MSQLTVTHRKAITMPSHRFFVWLELKFAILHIRYEWITLFSTLSMFSVEAEGNASSLGAALNEASGSIRIAYEDLHPLQWSVHAGKSHRPKPRDRRQHAGA
jgi:hypothetical protein